MTRRVQGNKDVALIECTNPKKDKWRVRWDVRERDDGTADYMEAEFAHKPSDAEIKEAVVGWYNSETDKAILSGFEYEGTPVWLSTENQFNYKAAYDLAVQTDGATLPVKFKLGTDDKPEYREFDTVDALADFFKKAMSHIQETLAEGWRKKDAFNADNYRVP